MITPIIFEEWKDIDFYDIKRNLYQVSNCGRVRNKILDKILSNIYSNGYESVQLQTIDSSRKSYFVHRLVACAFVNNEDLLNNVEVNHKDLYRNNNLFINLEWTTKLENIKHELYNQNPTNPKYQNKESNNWGNGEMTAGENNGMSIWTNEQVHKLCKALEDGNSYSDALILAGLPNTENNRFNVSHIVQRKRWKSISNFYKLPMPKSTNDYNPYIKDICRLLSEGNSIKDIIIELNINGNYDNIRNVIKNIKNRKTYTNISKDYNW